jgi:hypothetical protein
VAISLLIPVSGRALLQRFPSALHYTGLEHEAIQYYTTPPTDRVALLQSGIDAGEVRFESDSKNGYLASVLQELDIDVSSQLLVSSKTSLQLDHISPATPRALYFNDDIYVGWVQDSPIIEISSTDPRLGAIFYSFAEEADGTATFERETTLCIQCHNPESPSHVMTSVIPDAEGRPIFNAGLYSTTDQSPLPERWGGWYVTGTHGPQLHMGNLVLDIPPSAPGLAPAVAVNRAEGANLTTLVERVDTDPYISDHSDIVALMVFGHQINVQNKITYLNYEARKAIHEAQFADGSEEDIERRIEAAGEPLLEAMLFVGETALTAPVVGTSGYSEYFSTLGPVDAVGRSLRQFDLTQRLFRYPLSYLIYSRYFDSMPDRAKDYIYDRLAEVLSGDDQSGTFAHLSDENRRAISEILEQTHAAFQN